MNRVNPKLIGLFVTGGLLTLVALLIFFGGMRFGSQHVRFVLFFDQSVNGLTTGSTVKFRGVPIGTVDSIYLRFPGQRAESRAVPVVILIDQTRLDRDLGIGTDVLGKDAIASSIERGLVGRLTLESFITGQLFVELDFDRSPIRPPQHLETAGNYIEIPTIRSPIDQITDDIIDLISNVEQIDFAGLSENLSRVFEGVGVAFEDLDFKEISDSAVNLMGSLNEVIASDELGEGIAAIAGAARAIERGANNFAALMDKVEREGIPLGEEGDALIASMADAVQALADFATEGQGLFSTGSDFRTDLDGSLREVGRAARSLRQLVEYLERNPQSLLSGRERTPFRGGRDGALDDE